MMGLGFNLRLFIIIATQFLTFPNVEHVPDTLYAGLIFT